MKADDKLANMYVTQKSLTELLGDINHNDTESLRKEDNEKRDRLAILNDIIGLPYDKPTQFAASDIRNKTPKLISYVSEHGEELCALRLMPNREALPKLRMRGKTVTGAIDWFFEQNINDDDYKCDFTPHSPTSTWATIFVVNDFGIQGEIINGGHHQLTQGFHEFGTPKVFKFDFHKWSMKPLDKIALAHLKNVMELIYVTDKSKQKKLAEKLGATFINDYISGYFETVDSAMGTWYIDYSQSLAKIYSGSIVNTANTTSDFNITGQTGCPGKATGKVIIVQIDKINSTKFPEGSILVCEVTTPDYIPLMKKAAAIVTNQGGILSHAAIVARELKKPCIVGTVDATKKLKNGQLITVDADKGTILDASL